MRGVCKKGKELVVRAWHGWCPRASPCGLQVQALTVPSVSPMIHPAVPREGAGPALRAPAPQTQVSKLVAEGTAACGCRRGHPSRDRMVPSHELEFSRVEQQLSTCSPCPGPWPLFSHCCFPGATAGTAVATPRVTPPH